MQEAHGSSGARHLLHRYRLASGALEPRAALSPPSRELPNAGACRLAQRVTVAAVCADYTGAVAARMARIRSGDLGTAAVVLGILLLLLVFILATPVTSNRVAPAAAGPANCGPARLIAALPKTNEWRRNGWGSRQNQATSDRIAADRKYLTSRHVELSQWGPGAFTNKIVIFLLHYGPRAATILYARYGCAVIVSHQSVPYAIAGTGRLPW